MGSATDSDISQISLIYLEGTDDNFKSIPNSNGNIINGKVNYNFNPALKLSKGKSVTLGVFVIIDSNAQADSSFGINIQTAGQVRAG